MALLRRAAPVIIAWLAAITLLVPWQPRPFTSTLDLSWTIVLHEAFANHLRFGDDVVFTYGPWGFTYAGYDSRTFAWVLAAWLAIATAIVALLYEVAALRRHEGWTRAAFILLAVLFIALDVTQMPDVAGMALAFLFLGAHFNGGRRSILIAVAPVLALMSLSKFSFLLAAAVAIGTATGDDIVRRRPPASGGVYALALGAWWAAAHQPLSLAPRFLQASLEVASGYSEAMSLTFPWMDDRMVLALFVALACALVVLIAISHRRELGLRSVAYAGGTAAILFLTFKAGFVRQDTHDIIAVVTLAVIGISAVHADQFAKSWTILVIAIIVLAAHGLHERKSESLVALFARNTSRQVRAAARFALDGTAELQRDHRAAVSSLRAQLAVRPQGTSFDLYPSNAGVLRAWELPPRRRPVFQSHVAYTPRLLELNAAHLRSTRAPETILFNIEVFDHRLPMLADGLSWPEILSRYHVAGENGSYLELHRAARARSFRLVRIEERTARIGDVIGLPAETPLFVRLDIRPNLAGRAVTFLFKLPAIYATVQTDRGESLRYRMIRGNAAAGFILSPLVRSASDFAQLYQPTNRVARTTAIRIDDGVAAPLLDRQIHLTVYRVVFFGET